MKISLALASLSAVLALCSPSLFASPSAAPAHSTTAPAAASQPAQLTRINVWQAAVLGVVEGVTEYLPVSSTGHLILASHAMGLTQYNSEQNFFGRKMEKVPAIDAFEVVIQLGAILAVVGLYRRRVGQMASGLLGRNPAGFKLLAMLIVAFLPAAVVGLLLHKKIEEYLFTPNTVAWALAVGGLAMIAGEMYWRKNRSRQLTSLDSVMFWQALVIGLAQSIAMWPGTSRSMVTMLAALLVGMDMLAAAEFSFLLALPTLSAATLYSGYKNWDALVASTGAVGLIVGLAVSCIVAAIAVRAFVKWLTNHGMVPFGVYRIIAAVILYLLLVK